MIDPQKISGKDFADNVYRIIGERVKKLRTAKELNQQELANRLGLARTSITNIEKGRQRLLVHQIFRLANALEEDPAKLLDMTALFPKELPRQIPNDLTDTKKEWVRRVISGGAQKGTDKHDAKED